MKKQDELSETELRELVKSTNEYWRNYPFLPVSFTLQPGIFPPLDKVKIHWMDGEPIVADSCQLGNDEIGDFVFSPNCYSEPLSSGIPVSRIKALEIVNGIEDFHILFNFRGKQWEIKTGITLI